jgi:membrane associated rhomboid family serine protease
MLLPLGDLSSSRRPPLATFALVAANLAVWLGYELPTGVPRAVEAIGFHPCAVDGSCRDAGIPWTLESVTSMFGHGGWAHLVGNMVFLLAFGPAVERLLGTVRYLALYLAAGLAADALQGGLTLLFTHDLATVPGIGASGAISGVIGVYIVARPFERIVAWLMPALFVRIPALALLGVWFVLQGIEGAYTLGDPNTVVGIAFFAHVGGCLAGVVAGTWMLPQAWTRRLLPRRMAAGGGGA